MKSIIQMKKSWEKLNSRFEQVEESELDDRSIEIIHLEEQKEKRMEKNEEP